MTAVDNFSTNGFASALRLSRWVEGARAIGGIEAEAVARRPFHGTARVRAIGDTLAWKTSTGPHRLAWTRRLIAQADVPHLRLWFQRCGQVRMLIGEHEHILSPGEWMMLDSRFPYEAHIDDLSTVVAFQFPLNRLSGQNNFAAVSREVHRSDGGVARMVRQCLEIALQDATDSAGDLELQLGETLIDLAQLALRENKRTAVIGDAGDQARDRIRHIVRRNIQNPDLSVKLIAKAAGCSARYVHKLFNVGETIGCYIRTQRLERCRAELVAPATQERSITEIAFDNGFNSSSHFSRAFRIQYGMSPRECRERARH
jgi:AraC-like DNA-binding protein